ncbi:hypothetical protein BDP27DRAFT_1317597 [Rhodocollybia butyracea]|uniref:Uncharacterized protein n=1 Tax=Rhodocollybia butyracea TaxID=206335 RepID=A0A9P5PXH2_9AGAR|nr:hypothetical protein BDP27DRAFT_1317597 [Rhodocollybia butyracea]
MGRSFGTFFRDTMTELRCVQWCDGRKVFTLQKKYNGFLQFGIHRSGIEPEPLA